MTEKGPKLKTGRAHFPCGYYLRNSPVPESETWIYVGTNIFDEDRTESQSYRYFERPGIYFAKERVRESRKYGTGNEVVEEDADISERKLRIAESDLEALVYDYLSMRKRVAESGREPNADSAF